MSHPHVTDSSDPQQSDDLRHLARRRPGPPEGVLGSSLQEILRQLAEFTASALSDPWRVNVMAASPHDGRPQEVFLQGPDNACLRISLQPHQPDRVKVAGIYPEHHWDDVTHFAITVARDHGPDVLAKEIRRRLLVGYLPELARVEAGILELARQAQAREALIGQLPRRLEAHADQALNAQHHRIWLPSRDGDGDGPNGFMDIDTTGQDGVIHMSQATAAIMLAIAELITSSAQISPDSPL